jgi:hypothetical protein
MGVVLGGRDGLDGVPDPDAGPGDEVGEVGAGELDVVLGVGCGSVGSVGGEVGTDGLWVGPVVPGLVCPGGVVVGVESGRAGIVSRHPGQIRSGSVKTRPSGSARPWFAAVIRR